MHRPIVILLLLFAVVGYAQPTATPSASSSAATSLIYTPIRADVSPIIRNGRTFVPIRVIAEQFGATVRWIPESHQIRIRPEGQATILLTLNSRTAQVGTRVITLDAAPFVDMGRTMVPLRFVAESYGIPVTYNQATNSISLQRGDRLYILPLLSTRTGIIIADPRPGALVRNPIRIQGQGNVYEGSLIIEVQDMQGRILGRGQATAGMGGFYPFSTEVSYALSSATPIGGRIVVYSLDGKGEGEILARTSVDVTLASTQ